MAEHLVNAAAGPVADEAEFVAVEEPGGDLLDGGLLEVVGEGVVAGVIGIVGKIVTAEIEDPHLLTPGPEASGKGDDAALADQIFDIVNVDPIFGFAGFELKARDRPKRIVGGENFGLVRGEFFGGFGAAKDAVAFFVKMSAGGVEELGEDVVVGGVHGVDFEAGFDGIEGGEHIFDFRFSIFDWGARMVA